MKNGIVSWRTHLARRYSFERVPAPTQPARYLLFWSWWRSSRLLRRCKPSSGGKASERSLVLFELAVWSQCVLWRSKTCFRKSKPWLFGWQEQSWHLPLSLNWKVFQAPCLACVVDGWCLSGILFPTAASVVWSLALWEGLSCIDYLSGASEPPQKHPRLVCYSQRIIHHSEKSIKRTITSEKVEPLLRARDGCFSRRRMKEITREAWEDTCTFRRWRICHAVVLEHQKHEKSLQKTH